MKETLRSRTVTIGHMLASLISVILILLSIVDMRRGFLFGDAYLFKSPFLIFSPWQIMMLFSGVAGIYLGGRQLRNSGDKKTKLLLLGIFLILVGDFVLYRGVAMNRSLLAGKVGLDWMNAFGETGISKSFYLSVSYLLTVWHATFLSCLLGGLGLLAVPYFVKAMERSSSHRAGIMGTFFSLTQPLCSCCVAITSPSLLSSGIPRSFGISILLGAPLLNLSTLVLAGSLLPWSYAVIRILGGFAVTLILGLILSALLKSKEEVLCEIPASLSDTVSPPDEVVKTWFRLSGRLALWLFPSIIFGVMLTSFLWQFWPENFTNSIFSVAMVSVFGTLLMISTWSEIPLTLQLLENGLTGPAAAALIALPAVNFASLLLIGKSTRQWRLVLILGFAIMLISFLVGISFL